MKYPHIQQHDECDCGAACLSMISSYYGANYKTARIRELIKVDTQGANFLGLTKGANSLGFDTEALEGSYEELTDGIRKGEIRFPFIARIINELGFEHFIVVYAIDDDTVVTGDPGRAKITKMDTGVFREQWQEQILTLAPNRNFERVNEVKGSFRKYFRFITVQKKMLAFIFVISLVVTLVNISGIFVFEYVFNYATTESSESIHDEHDHEGHDHDDCDGECDEETDNKFLGKVGSMFLKLEEKTDIIFKNLATVCISVILLYLLRCLINIYRGYLLARTAKLVDVSLTTSYYDHLIDLPMDFYGTRKTGEYMSRFNDTSKIRDAISTTTLTIMLDTIMAVACGVVLYKINRILFLITLGMIALYALVMYLFRRPIKNVNHVLMEDEAQVTSYLKESIDGIETIRSYGSETAAKSKTKSLYEAFADKNVKAAAIYITQESIVTTIESVGIVVLLWIGAYLCGKSIITLADLVIFYYLIGYFISPVKNLINLQPELQTAAVAAERLNDIMDVDTEADSGPAVPMMNADIKVENVDFRYGYRELVLKDVSMCFRAGTKTAIVGETGCGKTTLVRLLMAFEEPESGSVTVGGNDLYGYSPASVRKKIAYISQDIFMFSDSIYKNLKIGNEAISDEEVEEICRKCGIDSFIRSLPMGYETVLEENGRNLSGGQKQRLAIARALLRKPEVLIMDEATSNLDVITEKSIQKMIDELSSDMTCIIIAHRLNTIKKCDNIYVMDKGHVAEEGTHSELLAKEGLYYSYLNTD